MMIMFRNSTLDEMKFYYLCQRFHPMMSWKVRTNWGYVSHPPFSGIDQNEEKNKKFFEENQADSLFHLHIKMTQHEMIWKLEMISGLLQEISFVAITWNHESNCTCREESFPIPLKYIDVSRTTHTSLDVLSEKSVDDYFTGTCMEIGKCPVPGPDSQDSQYCKDKPPDGHSWSLFQSLQSYWPPHAAHHHSYCLFPCLVQNPPDEIFN